MATFASDGYEVILGSFSGRSYYQPYIWCRLVSQSIDGNYSTVNIWFGHYKSGSNSDSYNGDHSSVYVTVNGANYSDSVTFDFRSASVGTYNDITHWDGIQIPHNADGSCTFSVSATHYSDISLGTGTVSGSFTLPTIARASQPTLSASSCYMGNSVTIYTNRASSSFYHVIHYQFPYGQTSFTHGEGLSQYTGVANSAVFTVPLRLLEYLPSGATSATCQIYVFTYTDSACTNQIGYHTASLTVYASGMVSIDNGSGFGNYIAYIDNGSSWDLAVPYMDSGSAWSIY